MAKEHDAIKDFLLDLGKEAEYDKVYSGDERPLDVRVRKKRTEFQPDVVWEDRGKRVILEVAFQDDPKQIVGEVALAAWAGNCDKIFIITWGYPPKELKKLKDRLAICWEHLEVRYGIEVINVDGSRKEMKRQVKKGVKLWIV